MIFIILW